MQSSEIMNWSQDFVFSIEIEVILFNSGQSETQYVTQADFKFVTSFVSQPPRMAEMSFKLLAIIK